jgi:hypothetical protein
MDKWVFRSNARRKQTYGVHESAVPRSLSPNGGESFLRFNSSNAAKTMVRDNIECLRAMRTDRYHNHLAKLRAEAVVYYQKVRKQP